MADTFAVVDMNTIKSQESLAEALGSLLRDAHLYSSIFYPDGRLRVYAYQKNHLDNLYIPSSTFWSSWEVMVRELYRKHYNSLQDAEMSVYR